MSLINPSFKDFIQSILPKEVEIKGTTDTIKSGSYIDLHLEIDGKRKPITKLYLAIRIDVNMC